MDLPPPIDGIHILRYGTPEYEVHCPAGSAAVENATVFKCSLCSYLCKNWDRVRMHFDAVHVRNGRTLPRRWKMSCPSGAPSDDGVITYVRGTPECLAAVPAAILQAIGSEHIYIYKCSMCMFFKERKGHVGNHYKRIHVLSGKPIVGRRKFPVDGSVGAITQALPAVCSSKGKTPVKKRVARALEFPTIENKKPPYEKQLLRVRTRNSSSCSETDKKDEDKKPWTFPSPPSSGEKYIFYGEWNQACKPVNDFFASLLPTQNPATPRKGNREAAEEQQIADCVVIVSPEDNDGDAWGDWNEHSGFLFENATTPKPLSLSSNDAGDFMDLEWDMLPNAIYD
jgi:hypothetical protein